MKIIEQFFPFLSLLYKMTWLISNSKQFYVVLFVMLYSAVLTEPVDKIVQTKAT